MKDYEYEIQGAPVVYTNRAPEPHNPLNRPEISYLKPIVALIVFIGFNIACPIIYKFLLKGTISVQIAIIAICIFDVCFLVIISKRAIIWLIHVYQHYAPDEVRLKCVYEPSCSEFMIMAIRKYGVIRGVAKGVARLLRCHPPNGGKDYP